MRKNQITLTTLALLILGTAGFTSPGSTFVAQEDTRATEFYEKSDAVRAAAVQLEKALGTVRGTRQARRAVQQIRRRVDELQSKAAREGVSPDDYKIVRNAVREALCLVPDAATDHVDGEVAALIEAVEALVASNPGGEGEARRPTFQYVCP